MPNTSQVTHSFTNSSVTSVFIWFWNYDHWQILLESTKFCLFVSVKKSEHVKICKLFFAKSEKTKDFLLEKRKNSKNIKVAGNHPNISIHEPLLLDSPVQIKLWKSPKLIFFENYFNKDKSVGL